MYNDSVLQLLIDKVCCSNVILTQCADSSLHVYLLLRNCRHIFMYFMYATHPDVQGYTRTQTDCLIKTFF